MLMSMQDIREMNKRKEQEQATTEAPAQGSGLSGLLQEPTAPLTPDEQFRDNHSTGGAIMRLLGTGLSGGLLGGQLIPELQKENQLKYASDLAAYGTDKVAYDKQQRDKAMLAGVMDGTEDGDDPFRRLSLSEGYGIDNLDYALGGGVVPVEEDWVKTEIDGQFFYTDNNNPTAAPIPIQHEDGTYAYADLTDAQAKNANYFERGMPRVMQMHALEDAGVTLPRAVLNAVARAENQKTGFVDGAIFDKILNSMALSPEQREYLDAAKDFSMINLRKDSGAAISASEMIKELQNTVMLDDMRPEHYLENRAARVRRATGLIAGMPRRMQVKYKDKLAELNGLSLDRVIKKIEEEAETFGVLRQDQNDFVLPTFEELMERGRWGWRTPNRTYNAGSTKGGSPRRSWTSLWLGWLKPQRKRRLMAFLITQRTPQLSSAKTLSSCPRTCLTWGLTLRSTLGVLSLMVARLMSIQTTQPLRA